MPDPSGLRPLGRSGLRIAPLVFGANVFGWTVDQPTAFRLLDRFVDAGLNAVDTADVYSRWVPGHEGGESETIIGRWLAKRGYRPLLVAIVVVGLYVAPLAGVADSAAKALFAAA